MPPTLKDSSTLPTSPENPERVAEGASAGQPISSAHPVTLEVPVTVNGARAVEGSDKREPFSETTSTVLVLANGAVIRLSSSVAPGQLLFLTNEKTKKEVVCQVVKSKNYRSASGYVELEFTEPVLGFWGMRFPGERHSAQANASLPVARKLNPATLPAGIPAANAEPKPALLVDAKPIEKVATNLADAVQEFKTEIKADSRPSSKADFLAPGETPTGGLQLDANRLEEQLSALLSNDQKQSERTPADSVAPPSKLELGSAAAKIFEIASEEPKAAKVETEPAKLDLISPQHTAPRNTQAPATSSFDDEEVKIPAWLEPLARSAAIPAPPVEPVEEGASDFAAQIEEWQAPQAPESASAAKHGTAAAKNAGSTSKPTQAAPLFGNSLLGTSTPELTSPRRSGKGIWMAMAAGFLVAAASGAWYFRDSLASLAPAHSLSGSNASPASTTSSVSLPSAPATNSAALLTPSLTPMERADTLSAGQKANPASAMAEVPAPVSSPAQGKMQTAAITERIPKSVASNDVSNGPEKSTEPVEPEITRPSLGKIRLAKPKVRRSASVQANGEMEPALEVNSGELASGENTLGANLAEGAKQPAAPAAPAGGDVQPARLISSVPPSYPALARTQHIAGDVRLDALIDATGRVTTMKVVSGPSLLHQAAMDSLRQWKYQAATLDGKPVPMHLTVTIQFHLQ
jgi:TonB family protein